MPPTVTASAADPALRDSFLGLLRSLAGAGGLDPEDLEQQVWLRAAAEPAVSQPQARLRALVLQEFRSARDRAERQAGAERAAGLLPRQTAADEASPELRALAAEHARELDTVLARLPARCPQLVAALLESPAFSYRELADELSMPRGSIGPIRSRCLACLRRLLGEPEPGGRQLPSGPRWRSSAALVCSRVGSSAAHAA
jgi:DNA-directed RNA polymerase specialized sigma24 family protein